MPSMPPSGRVGPGPAGRPPRTRSSRTAAALLAAALLAAVGPAAVSAHRLPPPEGLPPVARLTQLMAATGGCPGTDSEGAQTLDRARSTGGTAPHAQWSAGTWSVATDWYRLTVAPTTGVATLTTPRGRPYTRLPLVALAGFAETPAGLRVRTRAAGGALVVTATAPGLGLVSRAVVRTADASIEVTFVARLGPQPSLPPRFFFADGHGVSLAALPQGFSPEGRTDPFATHPSVRVATGAPFAPAPLDLLLGGRSGWLGLGLVQVPNATAMALAPDGALTVNYPLRIIAGFRDRGAGGVIASGPGRRLLAFPAFILTFGRSLWSTLRAYHTALWGLGAAPVAAPPGGRPGWWSEPLVDTWGQQMAVGADRGSPAYTAGWVRGFVRSWEAAYGLHRVTVVIDSQWQARLGSAVPRASFGGVAGMRRLIRGLQAGGAHVLLWWPLWVDRATVIPRSVPELLDGRHLRIPMRGSLGWPVDPTAPGFALRLRVAVDRALGHGPGDLGADGLKVDWGSWVPNPAVPHFDRPALGVGAAALLRWYRLLYADAQAVHPGALIDTSAAAPQFGGVTDLIRLYDARSQAEWQGRAAVVSAVDPSIGIDGDGWRLLPSQAIAHLVSSAVYGTPASYFATRWANGAPISTGTARLLGAILAMTSGKGQGVACPTAGGTWTYWVGGRLAAQSLAGNTALAVYGGGCTRLGGAVVLSALTQRLVVPFGTGAVADAQLLAGVPLLVAAPTAGFLAKPRATDLC